MFILSRARFVYRVPFSRSFHSRAKLNPVPLTLASTLYRQNRGVASSVSGRPGSQTLEHAALNIKEEVGNSVADAAKVIAGGNLTVDSKPNSKDQTFLKVTSSVVNIVPKPVLAFGLMGGIPYLGTSATVIYLARQAGLATAGITTNIDPGVALTVLDQALTIQVTYGAVMLSFLGALHWGMEFSGFGGYKGSARLALGTAPILVGWPTLALQPTMALVVQWTAFTGLWYADWKATNAGWAPKWYSQYRFYLSILVGTCIIGTLAGISHWGPVAGHGLLSHDLEMIKAERKVKIPESGGVVPGDIEAVSTGETGDAYIQVKRRKREEEKVAENQQKNESSNTTESS